MRELWNRLRDSFHRAQLHDELREELAFHEQMLVRDARAEAASDDDARSTARRRLGNTTRVREEARDVWGFPWLDVLQQDLRYTLRGLQRHPGFAIAVVLTLSLGIGANSAMFNVVDRMIFRPLPYLRDPASVHRVYLRSQERNRDVIEPSMEYTRYLDLKRWTRSFSQVAAFTTQRLAVGVGEEVQEREVALVSVEFFNFFDVRPEVGRFFVAAEDTTPRGAAVVVLGYDFWKLHFGGEADVLGKTVQVGQMLCTIVGVTPRGFTGVDEERAPALYMPITTFGGAQILDDPTGYFTNYSWTWMQMMVRRRPGLSQLNASADLSNAYARSWEAQRALEPGLSPVERARPRALASGIKLGSGPAPSLEARTALWVSGVAAIVFIIACANVANLFLARALRRRREIAVRMALGVSRRRLAAQCLTESIVLALMGGAAGVAIAQWGGALIRFLFFPDADPASTLGDWRTLSFAVAVALVAGVLTGLAPALFDSGSDLASTLKAGARAGTRPRSMTRISLLVFQGALSVVLLVGAGLFVRSLDKLRSMRIGYDPDPVLLVSTNMRGMRPSDDEMVQLGGRLVDEATRVPGVQAAAWASSVPLTGNTASVSLFVAGIDSVRRLGRFTYTAASPEYFKVMGTRILRGRALESRDRNGAQPVAVVSQAMANVLWAGKDAIGQCMHVRMPDAPCTVVIGIAENANQDDIATDSGLHYYLPIDQYDRANGSALLLRVGSDPALVGESMRKQLQRVMPGQSYVTARPLRDIVAAQRRSWLFGATMFVAFGVLALVVAALGLYSVIAYNVTERSHELGVRVALGAQSRDIARLVVGEGIRVALVGIVVGGAIALALGRWIEPLLFKVSSHDPLVFGFVSAILLFVAAISSAGPAVRAARADPNLALRAE